jgi:secondary thiamine-phosphate synthase enzyme
MSSLRELSIRSERRNQLIDITSGIQKIVDESGIKEGIAHIFVPHTTAAITINENADPTVQTDIMSFLEKLIPEDANFRHSEGNSDAHIKSSIVGTHAAVFIADGRIVFGTWQGIYFCEFDGPRSRRAIIKIVPDK